MREICEVLGFTRSNFYYQPKIDPSEEVLRDEIEQVAARYPTYGYRRITKLLESGIHRGISPRCPIDEIREPLSRSQTTRSTDGVQPWENRLKTLEVCRCDQVWVGDIT